MCLDVLISNLNQAVVDKRIRVLRASAQGPQIPILAFADDCDLFLKAEARSVNRTLTILNPGLRAGNQ